MSFPQKKQGTPPSSEAGAMGQIAIAVKYRYFLWWHHTHTHVPLNNTRTNIIPLWAADSHRGSPSNGTQAERACIQRISLPTMLNESEDIPLRDTKRFASYQRLVCKSKRKRRHSTHIISSTSALPKQQKKERSPQMTVYQCWRAIMLTESEDPPLRDTKRFAFQQWWVCKS